MQSKDNLKAKLLPECSMGSGLKAGDIVTFTNDSGETFEFEVILGFAETADESGNYIHLDWDEFWSPVKAAQLCAGEGASMGLKNALFLSKMKDHERRHILESISKHYIEDVSEILTHITAPNAEHILEYMVEPIRTPAFLLTEQLGHSIRA